MALAIAGCGPTAPDARPDVFLLTVDTLRADHLSIYGYGRPTSPWFADVAARGVVFERASASSSWTIPSVASFLTGMMPHQLAISAGEARRVPSTAETLAERLAARGYRTYAVTANAHLSPENGFDQGFEHYVNVGFASAEEVRAALEEVIPEIERREQPVFVWVHLFDPHDPYFERKPWVDTWSGDSESRQRLSTLMMRELRVQPQLESEGPALESLVALYDAEIAYTDSALRSIAQDLRIGDDDLLIVSADHGEEHRDHGGLGHQLSLYEETLRVPLVVSWPDRFRAGRVAERVSMVEVVPTVAEVVGEPVGPYGGVSTRSLLPVLLGEVRRPAAPIVADLMRQDGIRHRAVIESEQKLIFVGDPVERVELYDLRADPFEHEDLAAQMAPRVEALSRALRAGLKSPALAREPLSVATEADPDVTEQLRAMGYIE